MLGMSGMGDVVAHRSDIKEPPPLESPAQRDLVRILQVATDGQPARRPRHPQPERFEQPGQVGRGRLAFQVRVPGQDQLGDRPVASRVISSLVRRSSGPIPSIGLIAPPSTW